MASPVFRTKVHYCDEREKVEASVARRLRAPPKALKP